MIARLTRRPRLRRRVFADLNLPLVSLVNRADDTRGTFETRDPPGSYRPDAQGVARPPDAAVIRVKVCIFLNFRLGLCLEGVRPQRANAKKRCEYVIAINPKLSFNFHGSSRPEAIP